VLGGTQSLHTNGYDEALSLPTEEAAGIALRTQQIIAFESGAPDTADPLAGSFFVEALTAETEKMAWDLMAKIDAMGGAVVAVEQGFIQDEIARSAYQYQRDIEDGKKIIVGVNKFQVAESHDTPLLHIDDSIREEQARKLAALRSRRDADKALQCLQNVRAAAAGTQNLMPVVIEAVENHCTLGEIADELRAVYGEYK
jgi:methylmalonyl-CoA mutase N-terminal domain/subunit